MNILLIQIRPDVIIADHEFRLIVDKAELSPVSFTRINAGIPDGLAALNALASLDGFDAIMIGGSGEYLISRGDIPETISRITELLQEARRRKIPTLGICFGGQLMTQAFGGRVELDESRAEVGSFALALTAAAEHDPLFGTFPQTFDVQEGHKDQFVALPPGAVLLASSQKQPHQAWTFSGEPLYAVQFHPELDEEAMTYRVDYYAEEYQMTPEKVAQMHAALRPSPEASGLIKAFLRAFVSG